MCHIEHIVFMIFLNYCNSSVDRTFRGGESMHPPVHLIFQSMITTRLFAHWIETDIELVSTYYHYHTQSMKL